MHKSFKSFVCLVISLWCFMQVCSVDTLLIAPDPNVIQNICSFVIVGIRVFSIHVGANSSVLGFSIHSWKLLYIVIVHFRKFPAVFSEDRDLQIWINMQIPSPKRQARCWTSFLQHFRSPHASGHLCPFIIFNCQLHAKLLTASTFSSSFLTS